MSLTEELLSGKESSLSPGVSFLSSSCMFTVNPTIYLVGIAQPQTQAQAPYPPVRHHSMSLEQVHGTRSWPETLQCLLPCLYSTWTWWWWVRPLIVFNSRGGGILSLFWAKSWSPGTRWSARPHNPGSRNVPWFLFSVGVFLMLFILLFFHQGSWIDVGLTSPLRPVCHGRPYQGLTLQTT